MGKKKILIVDDERDALLILEKELTGEGYSVITADTLCIAGSLENA